jgi:superfamily II DNA or RNA helicase
MEIRPYQKEAIEVIKSTKEGDSTLIALPTGTGKAILTADVVSSAEGRSLIVVPSTELREQGKDKIDLFDDSLNVGFVQSKMDDVSSKVIIATRQSLTHGKSTRIERMLEHGEFEYLFFDEVHNAVDQLVKIKQKINSNVKIIGLSATPYSDLGKLFKGIDYRQSILDMIEQEYLCEPKALYVYSKTDLSEVRTIAGEFNQKQLEETVNNSERNDLVVKAYQEYAKDRKSTLIFSSGISHSIDLTKDFNKAGIYCKSVDSTNSDLERDTIIEEFRSGKLPVLVNVSILMLGFDHPPIDCLMYCRPTKSRILFEQILGRGLRLYEGKQDCLVIDVRDVVRNHNLMDISDVFGMEIKSGERVGDAKNRIKEEKIKYEEKLRRQELDRQKREEERQKQLELRAKQIQLFNKDVNKAFKEAYYDWFRVNTRYVLSVDSDIHYVINQGEGFEIYGININKMKYLESKENIIEAIECVENELVKRTTSFIHREALWKKDNATEKQLAKVRKGWIVKTKWDAHKYFLGSKIYWLFKEVV